MLGIYGIAFIFLIESRLIYRTNRMTTEDPKEETRLDFEVPYGMFRSHYSHCYCCRRYMNTTLLHMQPGYQSAFSVVIEISRYIFNMRSMRVCVHMRVLMWRIDVSISKFLQGRPASLRDGETPIIPDIRHTSDLAHGDPPSCQGLQRLFLGLGFHSDP